MRIQTFGKKNYAKVEFFDIFIPQQLGAVHTLAVSEWFTESPHGTLYVLHRVVSEHIYVHIRRFKHFQSLPYRLNAHCGVALAEWNGDSAVWVERT